MNCNGTITTEHAQQNQTDLLPSLSTNEIVCDLQQPNKTATIKQCQSNLSTDVTANHHDGLAIIGQCQNQHDHRTMTTPLNNASTSQPSDNDDRNDCDIIKITDDAECCAINDAGDCNYLLTENVDANVINAEYETTYNNLCAQNGDNEFNTIDTEQQPRFREDYTAGKIEKSDYRAAVTNQQKFVIRKFQKLDPTVLSTSPAPDVKIGQRVAYKEYYGNEFGTIRWIGRVPQISSDWTAGVEFDNAIGEGDGSLNGRRYFIAKDCFAKFLPLASVALVDQHVGRPEPGTMISVMSAAVRPGQMISIQRVSTVHVQHCFLNAPHRRPYGAELLAVNTRLHCQCPNCGPCAHVVKPPRTQRLRAGKNATHMCQFSTYTCCGMRSQEEAVCTYTGNKISPSPLPFDNGGSVMQNGDFIPLYNSWMQGSGYLTNLQAEQTKLMPEEYLLGAGPLDVVKKDSKNSSRRGSGRHANRDDFSIRYNGRTRSRLDSRQSSEQKRHLGRHNHHRHHHRHNKQNPQFNPTKAVQGENTGSATSDHHKIESYSTQQSDQFQTMGWPDEAKEVPNSYLNNTEFVSSAANELVSFKEESPALPMMAITARDLNESSPRVEEPRLGTTSKAAKVQHRDSIENRYLFPTDDIIESTLEADLENLSQARYGSTSNGRNQSLSSTKNILKSLRSLVSCLSGATKSNCPSDFERHSENTFRFYEHPKANEINNRSPPVRDVRARSCSCSSSGGSNSDGSDIGNPDMRTKTSLENESGDTSYSFNIAKNDRNSPAEYLHSDVSSGIADEELHMFKPVFNSSYNFVNQSVSNYCYYSNSSPTSVIQQNDGQYMDKQISFASALSDPLASGCECTTTTTKTSTNSATMASHPVGLQKRHQHHNQGQNHPQQQQHQRRKRRQASSSSDCGFSSASQNSINFRSQPSCSPVNLHDAEQKCINQTYKRIVERLLSSSSAVTNEDLCRLRRALAEIHSDSCCLHHRRFLVETLIQKQQKHPSQTENPIMEQDQHSSQCLFEMNEEYEQLITDIIRKSLLESRASSGGFLSSEQTKQESIREEQRRLSACCQQTPPLISSIDGPCNASSVEFDTRKDVDDHVGLQTDPTLPIIPATDDDSLKDQSKNQLSLELEAESSENIKCSASEVSSLPKTFELKLTLSINEKSTKKASCDYQPTPTAKQQTNDQANEELNQPGTAPQTSGSEH